MSLCRVKCAAGDQPEDFPDVVLFLGEIPNMPLHAAVADVSSGQVIVGLHLDRLEELAEDET